MADEIVASPSLSKSATLRRDLARSIASGDLNPGDRLPSSRELGERYGMSHVTVGQAVEQLVSEGLIVKRRGAGTYVAPRGHTGNSTLQIHDGSSKGHSILVEILAEWNRQCPELRAVHVERPELADVRILTSANLDRLGQAHSLQPLDPFAPKRRTLDDTFHPFLMRPVCHNGHSYAIPLWFSPEVLAYNRELLGRHATHIDYWSLDDMLAATSELTSSLAARDIRSCSVVKRFRYQLFPLLAAFGAPVVDPSYTYCLLDSPESIDALSYAQSLSRASGRPPGETSNIDDLLAGRLAIKSTSARVVARFAEAPAFDLAIAPYPTGRFAGGQLTGAWAGITAWCKQPQAAWRLIDFLSNREQQQKLADSDCFFPARREACQSLLARHGGVYDAVYRSASASAIQPTGLREEELSFIDRRMRDWWLEDDLAERLRWTTELVNARLDRSPGNNEKF